jgi:peptidoglycan/LPS O-acetylase OafA/YrhL
VATQELDTTEQRRIARESDPVRDALPWIPAALRRQQRWRPEIQALRALAVTLVIASHIWPGLVPGGFVGVDVFFAVSGFLITSMLVEEIVEEGRIGLARFWARRARRILPAALATLLVTAVATMIVVPSHRWDTFLTEIAASAAYVENWQLAHAAVDYFARSDGVSPVQHYWSLSVEEQFYLVWPLLLTGAVLLTRGRTPRARITALAATMGTLTAVSLWWSIFHTPHDPAAAYFVTPTRAWEFGLGGILALLPQRHVVPPFARALLSWLGFAAILTAAFAYGPDTIFPGVAALLPILGTLAVIRAGAPAVRGAPTRLLAWGPVQRTGDLSYSLYLWHWPLLVLIPYVAHLPDGVFQAVVLELTVLLAWLSKRWVEDPVRNMHGLARRPRRTLALAGIATLLVLMVPAAGALQVDHQLHQDRAQTRALVGEHPRCFGAAARPPDGAPCDNPELKGRVVPSPVEAAAAANTPCQVTEVLGRVRACAFGVPAAGARESVAVVGDSHASHWRAAFDYVAKARGWHGFSVTHTSCPFTAAIAKLPEPQRSQCVQWTRDTVRWFGRHPEVHRVFVAGHTGGAIVGARGAAARFAAQVKGYRDAWASLPATVTQVVVLRDTPKMRSATLDCVQQAMNGAQDPARACAVPRATALEDDPAVEAAGGPGARRPVAVVDLTSTLCDRVSCYPVVGGALTFKDVDHLTTVFAATLGPYLQAAVQRLS